MSHDQENLEPAHPQYMVDESKPFSRSLIWEIQRRYYERHGVKAWSEGRIPFSITTNPAIAYTYAQLIYAGLRDWLPVLDVSEPVYIVEIGAGSGRLGFHILRQLSLFWDETPLAHINLCYVLTDLVEENVQFWESHPALQPFAETGKLDFARYDVSSDTGITLRRSGAEIKSGTLKNPLIVLANYLWDSLPHDLFFVDHGDLYEVQTALVSEQPEPDKFDPDLITRVGIMYNRFPIKGQYYDDELLAALLDEYRQSIPESLLTFPLEAIRCLQSLMKLSNQKLLMLSADKGDHRLEELVIPDDVPPIILHDSGFSIQPNYHAIVRFFEQHGGTVLAQPHQYIWLNVLACSLGAPATMELRQMYRQVVEIRGPDDLFAAVWNYDELPNATIPSLLAYLRLKHYDPHAFLVAYSMFQKALHQGSIVHLASINLAIQEIWKNYYHMGEPNNTPFLLATILHGVRNYVGALALYEQAIALYGDHARIRYNIALCHWALNRRDQAKGMVAQILEEVPDFPEAQQMYATWLAEPS